MGALHLFLCLCLALLLFCFGLHITLPHCSADVAMSTSMMTHEQFQAKCMHSATN